MDKLNEATVLAKKLESQSKNVSEVVAFAHKVIDGKLKLAERQNEFVYHDKVPDRTSLPELKVVSLVKGIPFDMQDPEIAGRDIFHRLVSIATREAFALYRFHLALVFLVPHFYLFLFQLVRKRLNSSDRLAKISTKRTQS